MRVHLRVGRRAGLLPFDTALLITLVSFRPPTPQIAALWDELHTKMPWRNAVGGGPPVRPFPDQGADTSADGDGLVLYIAVNSVSGGGGLKAPALAAPPSCASSLCRLCRGHRAQTVCRRGCPAACCCLLQGLTSRKRRDILRRTWVPSGKLQVCIGRGGAG